MNNSSGKVLVIILVITAVILISLTAISLFFFQKETERRKLAEVTSEEYLSEKAVLEEELKDVKKQNFLLDEKNKEADERVNDLSDELELEQGLREEMKLETVSLQETIEELEEERDANAKSIEETEELKAKFEKDLTASEQKIKELEAQLAAELERSQKLGELYKQQEEEVKKLEESRLQQEKQGEKNFVLNEAAPKKMIVREVELETIVIDPDSPPELIADETPTIFDSQIKGRILSVDIETGFVIVNLGTQDGLSIGNILSIYRNENYVGDIKITRLQSEMSAADLILPLSVGKVRKNDQVKTK